MAEKPAEKKICSEIEELDDWSVNLEDAFEIGEPLPPDPKPKPPKKPRQKINEVREEDYFSCSSGNGEDDDDDGDDVGEQLEEVMKNFQSNLVNNMTAQMNSNAMFDGIINMALDYQTKRSDKLKGWMATNRRKLTAREIYYYEKMLEMFSEMADVYKKHPNDKARAQAEATAINEKIKRLPVKYPAELEAQFQAEATSGLLTGMLQGVGEGLQQKSGEKPECRVM